MTVIIHIGSSKAMSTSIQSHFQTLSNDFFYFGVNFDNEKFKNKGVGDSFLDADCFELTMVLCNLDRFQGLDPKLKQNIQKKVKQAEEQNKIFFYSSESLCETTNLYLALQILKEIFNDFKILYITRNQFDIIKSLYFYEGHKSSYLIGKDRYKFIPFDTFFNTALLNDKRRGGHKSGYWVHDFIRVYNYNQIINIINKHLPEEDIFVFPFEEIAIKKDINIVLEFIEKKVNKKFSSKIKGNSQSFNHINASNKKNIFFRIYAFLSAIKINPHNLNKKLKKFINYKKFLVMFDDLKIDEEYFYKIKKIYFEDNLQLVEKFDTLKKHKSTYLFEEDLNKL